VGVDLLLDSSKVVDSLLLWQCCLIFLAFLCLINGEDLHLTGELGLSSNVLSTA
jgi:hypothetical protein